MLAKCMDFSLRAYYTYGRTLYINDMLEKTTLTLNRFCQCLPHPFTFIIGSHCIFVMSRDLSINIRINFSDTHFQGSREPNFCGPGSFSFS